MADCPVQTRPHRQIGVTHKFLYRTKFLETRNMKRVFHFPERLVCLFSSVVRSLERWPIALNRILTIPGVTCMGHQEHEAASTEAAGTENPIFCQDNILVSCDPYLYNSLSGFASQTGCMVIPPSLSFTRVRGNLRLRRSCRSDRTLTTRETCSPLPELYLKLPVTFSG